LRRFATIGDSSAANCCFALPTVFPLRSIPLLLLSTLVAVLLGELGLRLADQSYYWALVKRPDPALGWRPPAYQTAWQRFEGSARVQTNALGFRDLDHAPAKPPGTLRIAVLGDSFTEAVQVPFEETWWRVMGATLNADVCQTLSTEKVEVLNFAVSGYSTAQALLAWRTEASQFAPDMAILAFFIGNDLNENARALDNEPLRPHFQAAPDGLTLDDGFLHSAAYRAATSLSGRAQQWLLEHSRVAQLVVQARDAWRMARLAATRRDHHQDQHREPQEYGVDNAIYRPPDTPAWEDAWQATEAMLAAFATETRAAGVRPALMIIGTGTQVHPNLQGRDRFAATLGLDDLGYPVRRLLETAQQHRLPVLNLPAEWAAPAEVGKRFLYGLPGGRPGFGHWNAAGHQAAGEAAAELVCWLLAQPPRTLEGRVNGAGNKSPSIGAAAGH
jgi:hypothetical protein